MRVMFFFHTRAKIVKIFESRQQQQKVNEIRQAFNILINLEKNETIGWKNVRFAVRQVYCLETSKKKDR